MIPRIGLAVLLVTACAAPRGPQRSDETRSFPAAANKLVLLDLASLDVEVRVANRADISLTTELEARSSSPGAARRWVESHSPRTSDDQTRLRVELPPRRSTLVLGSLRTRGRVVVELPASSRLEVRTSSGDVVLEGEDALTGVVRITTRSGDVRVDGGVRDELVVRTASGDLEIGAPLLAALEARTSSGDIQVRAPVSRVLIDSSSGDVDLDGLSGEASVRTRSGDVDARWTGAPDGAQVKVRSTSGDVWLALPGPPAGGSAVTRSGRIRSDFDGEWDRQRRSVALAASHGGPLLELETVSGDITLRGGPSRSDPAEPREAEVESRPPAPPKR